MEHVITSLSKRGLDFLDFAFINVLQHIECGDAPNDTLETWTAEDCVMAISECVNRFGWNSREGQDELDMMKIAHFAQLAFSKMENEKNNREVPYVVQEP